MKNIQLKNVRLKNVQGLLSFIFALALGPLACACFSPWAGDEGIITIALGSAPRSLDRPDEIDNFKYEITLNDPSGIVPEWRYTDITDRKVDITVAPGKWNIQLKAYFCTLDDDKTFEFLQAVGLKTVNVKAGRNLPVIIDMISASEVSTWEELKKVTDFLSVSSNSEEIIIIKNNIPTAEEIAGTADHDPYFDEIVIYEGKTITLIAEEAVTIFSNVFLANNTDYPPSSFFHVYQRGSLILGSAGMSGTITIDGGNLYSKDSGVQTSIVPMVSVDAGAELLMYDKVTLQNNEASAVKISGGTIGMAYPFSGKFTMRGGTISENKANGGGVNNSGIFDMHGGTINKNEALDGNGGGVWNAGFFTMWGGTISGNKANSGGGVYNSSGGTFTMWGGTITDNNASIAGGGVYTNSMQSLWGGTITGNIPDNISVK